jgi:hypothetical protein
VTQKVPTEGRYEDENQSKDGNQSKGKTAEKPPAKDDGKVDEAEAKQTEHIGPKTWDYPGKLGDK